MKHLKKSKFIIIFILIIACIVFGFLFNACFFHKNAVISTQGHYEPQVYITATGECYHSDNCSYIMQMHAIGLYQAQTRGYRSCFHCGGTPCGTIWINGIPETSTKNNYLLSFVISLILIGVIGIWLLNKYTLPEDNY